jgi:hypothetical protein
VAENEDECVILRASRVLFRCIEVIYKITRSWSAENGLTTISPWFSFLSKKKNNNNKKKRKSQRLFKTISKQFYLPLVFISQKKKKKIVNVFSKLLANGFVHFFPIKNSTLFVFYTIAITSY